MNPPDCDLQNTQCNPGNSLPVALLRHDTYTAPALRTAVGQVMDAARLAEYYPLRAGTRVLVKPNLLMAKHLACTSPEVVAAVCAWIMDHGAQVRVADSPGFGRAVTVARAVGLDEALRPLGLEVEEIGPAVPLPLPLEGDAAQKAGFQAGGSRFHVARLAMESDLIVSVPRVKAHAQMLTTLSVKNCFGCVRGLHKAVAHAREGRDPRFFADCLAALWATLPPVAAVADGITAMHITGPSNGKPFALGLLGASASAVALDEAVYAVLGLNPQDVPLGAALSRRKAWGSGAAGSQVIFPLNTPADFCAAGFQLPVELSHTSFHPARFVQSCFRRIFAAFKK
ncbi:DUF362 domain-containing protein [Desulfovibrio sp.]|uniref:DUF362 domain-containing protein n=1 Tax=Desulfovibrio sp. TaxID=885 RepID=UPI0025BADD45|nr:DUF362 domain-containing protein [Desulfovibrio sp.]